ncbi:lipase [Williamsia sp. Leaf354]|uniref:esterase/lipase family protein n=1 Tax=Williamsia sp. Leaf354 TaxID=1736349 RepID=UPI000701F154|nr:alpha/beta fold hydrolase [Williamsia sp. Leaf354]KQR96632.1 lipase [Williamsia sp. Leaf354]
MRRVRLVFDRARVARLLVIALLSIAGPLGAIGSAGAAPAPATPATGGYNSSSCRPAPAHPRPVILVHGTWTDSAQTWQALAPALAGQGYCVFAIDYGRRAAGSTENLMDLAGGDTITRSATTLARFVDRVRRETGSARVDMVGHSQGALVIRQYLKFDGGAPGDPARNAVNTVVTLAGTNHGTTFDLNQTIGAIGEMLGIPVVRLAATTVGPSYVEQMVGSPFLDRLNAGGDTRPGIRYVVVGTRDDTVVTPPERTFLRAGPGATVRNTWVQDGCGTRQVDHMQMTSDARAVWIVLDALDPTYRATHPAPCR